MSNNKEGLRASFFSDPTSLPSVLNQPYLPSLDGFRAISIIFVIFYHGPNEVRFKWLDGHLGVKVFFVISGFLITSLLLKEKIKTNDISLRKFYARRFFRIIPLVILFLAILLLLNYIFKLNVPPTDFLTSLFFIKNITFLGTLWYTIHFWSLSVEEQFYIIHPVLIKKGGVKGFFFVSVLLLSCIPVITYARFHIKFFEKSHVLQTVYDLVANVDGVIVGSIAAILLMKYEGRFRAVLRYKVPIIIMGIISIYCIQLNYFWFVPDSFNGLVISPIVAMIILLNLYPSKDFFFRFLNYKAVKYVGTISYSLYVWQQLFTYKQPWGGLFKGADNFWVNIVILFMVAAISYSLYEKKFISLGKKYKSIR